MAISRGTNRSVIHGYLEGNSTFRPWLLRKQSVHPAYGSQLSFCSDTKIYKDAPWRFGSNGLFTNIQPVSKREFYLDSYYRGVSQDYRDSKIQFFVSTSLYQNKQTILKKTWRVTCLEGPQLYVTWFPKIQGVQGCTPKQLLFEVCSWPFAEKTLEIPECFRIFFRAWDCWWFRNSKQPPGMCNDSL